MHSWGPLVGVLLLYFVGKPLLLHILVFSKLRNFRLGAPDVSETPREETPPALAAILGSVENVLQPLGFQFERAVFYTPVEGESFKRRAWFYINRDTFVRVMVSQLKLNAGDIPMCLFESSLEDGRMLFTGTLASSGDSTTVRFHNRIQEMPLDAQYHAHLDFVQGKAAGKRPVLLEPSARDSESKRNWIESTQLRLRRGDLQQVRDGKFAYNFKESVRRTISACANQRKLNQSKAVRASAKRIESVKSTAFNVDEEVEEYLHNARLSQSISIGAVTKVILLLLSMGLFVAAFRMSLSWETLLILMAVLTFHEGGHLLGMRIFGYKNLQMLYLPFLGAVAIGGKREYVKPWKELTMLFMGPLPGFVIGLVVLTNPAFENLQIRRELGIMLLVLNLFNLLPIHPLDGGQIWDILLFRRFPYGRVVFLGLGAVTLLLAGAGGLFGSAFVGFGVLLLLQLPNNIRQAKLIRSLRNQFGSPLCGQDEKSLLPAIFDFMHKHSIKLKLNAKNSFVAKVLAQCKADPAGPGTVLYGLAAYTSPVWVAIIVLTAQQMQSKARVDAQVAQARSERLLELPPELTEQRGVDATPVLRNLKALITLSDADLKLEAIQRHVTEPNPNWADLRKSLNDPAVAAVLVDARQAAAADYTSDEPEKIVPRIEVVNWLAISAECAAGNSEPAIAWPDLESALRLASMKDVSTSAVEAGTPQTCILQAMDGMKIVMGKLGPPRDEINRLQGLLGTGRLAQPILADRLKSMIDMATEMSFSGPAQKTRIIGLLGLLVPDLASYRIRYLDQIRDIKRRLQVAASNPDAPEEAIFGAPANKFGYDNDCIVASIRLAKAALAVEDYRLAHRELPTKLADLASLTDDQRNMLAWHPQTSMLVAKRFGREFPATSANQSARVMSAVEDADDAEDEVDGGNARYTWNIRPSAD